jgi:hypothetical protein
MRKIIFTALIVVLFAGAAHSQVEKQIAAIKAEVSAINKAAKEYTKTEKKLTDISGWNGDATYYTSGKSFRKIAIVINRESSKVWAQFYYQNDELIFISWRNLEYPKRIEGSRIEAPGSTREIKYYFADGALIRLLWGKDEISRAESSFESMREHVVSWAGDVKAAF